MSTFSDVFARKEKKYRLSAAQYRVLLAVIEGRLATDEYGFSQVRSLYFDTPEFALVEHSLDKPLYKEKLRVRVYGEPTEDAQAFVEIKKKFKGIVYKRRVSMTLAAAHAYLNGMPYDRACLSMPLVDEIAAEQSLSARSLQIAREIDFFRDRYARLHPSMLIVCNRSAFGDPDGGDLRVTFDANIAANPQALDLDETEGCKTLITEGDVIMEIKNAGPLPFWFVDTLSACRAYPQSFSKYGTAYMKLVSPETATDLAEAVVPAAVPTSVAGLAPAMSPSLAPVGASASTIAPAAAAVLPSARVSDARLSTKTARGRHARVNERSRTCA